VGINTYSIEGNELRGCVNDARAWAETVVDRFGFARADVRVLLDREAAKADIMAALRDLLAGARAGDVLAFTNSSHGSYLAHTDGDEETYDEVLCPFDVDRNIIVDDELRELFSGLPKGVRLTVILDNCFSGTGTRLAAPGECRARFLSPALLGKPVLREPATARPARRQAYPQSKMKETLLTGCSETEYSYDARFGGVYHGAMTHYALQAIAEAGGRLSYRQWHARLGAMISAFPQHPQLEGAPANKRRMLFS
jgi:hypothetical protein